MTNLPSKGIKPQIYAWIGRDKNKELHLFGEQPQYEDGYWLSDCEDDSIWLLREFLSDIQPGECKRVRLTFEVIHD